ncbi:MAG: hypothetical protein HY084_10065 [Gemmatimonadetes bacterium]|nr:hypothetical protein [Gemmatimonadota bacterium]
MPALTFVRACIAEAALHGASVARPAPDERETGDEGGHETGDAFTLGSITLRAAQRDTLRQVRRAVAEFGGALLADEPGLGKTFVALAFARARGEPLVIAPAALRVMWHDAAARAATPIEFVSFERLSRAEPAMRRGVVIVDEAHHAGARATARYPRLARLCAGAELLLLSATPVRNRRA